METDLQSPQLKEILENLTTPDKLDSHPWTRKLFVIDACKEFPEIQMLSPGRQLVEAVTRIFLKIMPALPPRRGLRLDTRWGEFGILAALYFAPYRFGEPKPTSLREAWQGIDKAILLFVFGQSKEITAEDRERFRLVGGETEIAANSTISDWHRKGLEHLAGVLNHYENTLAARVSSGKGKTKPGKQKVTTANRRFRTVIRYLFLLIIISIFLWTGFTIWKTYQRVQSIKENSQALLGITQSYSEPGKITEAGTAITALRGDLQGLKDDLAVLWMVSPYLGWLPAHGGDIAQAPSLLEMGLQLSIAGDETFQAISPALSDIDKTAGSPAILDLIGSLKDGSTRLLSAQSALASARAARQTIQLDRLSPKVKTLLEGKIDPLLSSIQGAFPVDDLLQMARLAPRLLGAMGNGPQTYLIMIQNEDELRPTGGFLSAVGLIGFENGKLNNLSFESYELVEDLSKPYPKAPWQLDKYMMSEMLLLRDANWFTDFPTSVEWVRFLYAYTRPQPVQGVMAIDQHVLVEMLRQIGPLHVEGEADLITADNVLMYMRSAKEQKPPEGVSVEGWDRKRFINRMAKPLQQRLMQIDSKTWQNLAKTLISLQDEKHILLYTDDPEMKELVSRRGWDGAVRPANSGDFLMVVDSNIGFNKTNVMMDVSEEYQVDLTDPTRPSSRLTIQQTNRATTQDECIQGRVLPEASQAEKDYRTNECYWSYLRVYVPAGSELLSSTPHPIPAKWSLREQEIPTAADILDEGIPGIQAFGLILVVPGSQSQETMFDYRLPSTAVNFNDQNSTWTYDLKVQKQPGTLNVPLKIHILPPAGMKVINPPDGMQTLPDGLVYSTNLKKDISLKIEFRSVDQ